MNNAEAKSLLANELHALAGRSFSELVALIGHDEVKVVIVPQPGASPTPESILDFCRGKMAHYAVPRYVEVVEGLPKTETHRIQYAALKALGITQTTWDREAVGYKVEKV